MKKYVITGSTSGIGNALTKAFAKNNIVFAGYRNSAYVDELKAISENVIPFYIDMTERASITDASNFIKSRISLIDTLINAAGCVVAGAVENLDIQNVRKQFEVNTFSHLEFSQNLLPMLENGKIINISSMASFGIFPFISPYCASKRAMDILFNSLSVELKKTVKIISVKPGAIATPLWEKSIELNNDCIKNDKTYAKEMNFLAQNAIKNQTKGLDVNKVVNMILKIDKMKNPKSSYTIGFDAKIVEIVSKLPQDLLNKIVKYNLKLKFNN